MLEQANRLLVHQLSHHITEDCADGVEALICLADVLQTHVVEQDLLHDKDGHRLAELTARLHDTEAEGNDLGGEEEVDDFGAVVLDERTDDAERREAKVLEWARLGGGIEEGVEEERDVC